MRPIFTPPWNVAGPFAVSTPFGPPPKTRSRSVTLRVVFAGPSNRKFSSSYAPMRRAPSLRNATAIFAWSFGPPTWNLSSFSVARSRRSRW